MHDAFKNPHNLRLFPDRLFYKIGEVSKIVGVEPYVLRYWETEFPFLKPKKSKSGQRIYTKDDIDIIMQIKHLLYEEKYTIDGVRKRLCNIKHQPLTEINKKDTDNIKKQNEDIRVKKIIEMVRERLNTILKNIGS
jgi:DNA-binding transcriptional MerR regulator